MGARHEAGQARPTGYLPSASPSFWFGCLTPNIFGARATATIVAYCDYCSYQLTTLVFGPVPIRSLAFSTDPPQFQCNAGDSVQLPGPAVCTNQSHLNDDCCLVRGSRRPPCRLEFQTYKCGRASRRTATDMPPAPLPTPAPSPAPTPALSSPLSPTPPLSCPHSPLSAHSAHSAVRLRNFSYPTTVTQHQPNLLRHLIDNIPHLSDDTKPPGPGPLPPKHGCACSHSCELSPSPSVIPTKKQEPQSTTGRRRSHLFYWTPSDPPLLRTGVGSRQPTAPSHRTSKHQQDFKQRRRSALSATRLLQGLTWSSTLTGSPQSPTMPVRDDDVSIPAFCGRESGRNMAVADDDENCSLALGNGTTMTSTATAASFTTAASTSTTRSRRTSRSFPSASPHVSASTNGPRKPARWLSHVVGWLSTSEPSQREWKNHQADLYRQHDVSKAESNLQRSMKLRAPIGELPPEATSLTDSSKRKVHHHNHANLRPAGSASSQSTASLNHVAPWQE